MSTARALREQIALLVRQYHDEQFSNRAFNPDVDLTHYAGRVFDAEELCVRASQAIPLPFVASTASPYGPSCQ